MYFDLIAADTMCAGATLEIRRVKPKLRCTACGALFERQIFRFDCPDCGADGEPTEIGRELYIETIDIEAAGPPAQA
jgi:hydrogenase nickel incorporation protein HypA/HybF